MQRKLKICTFHGVTGVLLYRWMASYEQVTRRADISQMGEAVTFAVGIICSLALSISYLPPALALHGKAEELAASESESHRPDEKARQEWLARHGLTLSPLDLAIRIGSALAPLILDSQLPT